MMSSYVEGDQMASLLDYLQAHFSDRLTFEDGRVAWDKALLLTLRKLGYELKLEDYATKVFLYRGTTCFGEIDYTVKTVGDDENMHAPYEVRLLDLSPFEAPSEP